MRPRKLQSASLGAGLLLAANVVPGLGAELATVSVTVSAPDHDVREAPVSVVVPPFAGSPVASASVAQADLTAAQIGAPPDLNPVDSRLTWIVRDLKAGERRTYHLAVSNATPSANRVEVKRNGENVDFFVNGKLFTRYDTTTGPNKPYFYPVNAPTGQQIVRHWPLEKVEGETQDHPHHRGLWFTHGKVNGVDFWLESKGTGRTVHTGYEKIESGPVYGLMRATTDWLTPDAKKIAEDVREVRVYNTTGGYLMDFAITIKAVGGPLVWGDTKEGTFALRLADSMRANAGKGKQSAGHIVNAAGDKDGAAWGKAAAWCDYYGPVDGQVVGVAIFDDPRNPRHPTTWHVRDYGLFAANPFGLHDFDKKNPPGTGDLTVPENESVTFRYRLFFHKGTPEDANIPAVWQAFSAPPTATLNSRALPDQF